MPKAVGNRGKCLCGAVTIWVGAAHTDVGICHCAMCRRWGSGPNMAIEVGKDLVIDGFESITTYRSSEWAERAFCRTCGSNLYYRIVEEDTYAVCVGLFEEFRGMELKSQIFIDEKPDFYAFANETVTMTGAEVFALYASPGDGK
ncbi:MAG: GFA family protein [Pseudomonadota bacterium]